MSIWQCSELAQHCIQRIFLEKLQGLKDRFFGVSYRGLEDSAQVEHG
jgi:hypothetical protein